MDVPPVREFGLYQQDGQLPAGGRDRLDHFAETFETRMALRAGRHEVAGIVVLAKAVRLDMVDRKASIRSATDATKIIVGGEEGFPDSVPARPVAAMAVGFPAAILALVREAATPDRAIKAGTVAVGPGGINKRLTAMGTDPVEPGIDPLPLRGAAMGTELMIRSAAMPIEGLAALLAGDRLPGPLFRSLLPGRFDSICTGPASDRLAVILRPRLDDSLRPAIRTGRLD